MSEADDSEMLPNMRRVKVNRTELASFLPTPRLIKAFEDLTANVQQAIPDAIKTGDNTAVNALLGASLALGRGESARSSSDRLVPAVQALESRGATDRLLSGELARLARRLDQVEALVQALTRANSEIQRLQSRIAQLEALVIGA